MSPIIVNEVLKVVNEATNSTLDIGPEGLTQLGLPGCAAHAKGQQPGSVLLRAPATEPHNYAQMLEAGAILPHPSGRFVRP